MVTIHVTVRMTNNLPKCLSCNFCVSFHPRWILLWTATLASDPRRHLGAVPSAEGWCRGSDWCGGTPGLHPQLAHRVCRWGGRCPSQRLTLPFWGGRVLFWGHFPQNCPPFHLHVSCVFSHLNCVTQICNRLLVFYAKKPHQIQCSCPWTTAKVPMVGP